MTDPRVIAGLRAQMERRAAAIAAGARPLGWKIGLNLPQVQRTLGIDERVIGFLTTDTELEPGRSHSLSGGTRVAAEPEVAIHMRADVGGSASEEEALAAIGGLGPAIEVVDVDLPLEDVEAILAGNVFHRAVLFGAAVPGASVEGLRARLLRNGVEEAAAVVPGDLAATVLLVARLAEAAGERLRAGDRIIAGSLTRPLPPAPGDELELELGRLGSLRLSFDA